EALFAVTGIPSIPPGGRRARSARAAKSRGPRENPRSPALASTQLGDVGQMMASVPGIQRQHLVQGERVPVLGMAQHALPVGGLESLQQQYPAPVQGLEQVERELTRSR